MSWSLHYQTVATAAQGTDVQDLVNFVLASLNAIPTGATAAPVKYLSSALNGAAGASLWEAYDVTGHLNGSPAGSPVLMGSWGATALGISGAVPEAACATVTMQAPYGTDVEFAPGTRPRARDRGRIYWGPIGGTTSLSVDANNRTIIIPACRTDLGLWIKAINAHTTIPSNIPYTLAVWSRKNALMKGLAEVWVDDRPDYQHKRAGQASTKTITALP
jgi:hypothetical protein